MKPFILGATFARGGSKGILKKNIKDLAGKPLIAYAIADGLKCILIDKYIVSTDDVQKGLDYGVAFAALKHSFPGDFNWCTKEEVEALLAGTKPGVNR